ncbi:hypothetical protein [Streptomyces hesseae]|uniref:DUF3072 domain-containing protein n=1 Tax=Streptomyces hesseae TaxID=3075519 RepID=A0ABU2SZK5_9ACTN|nr:hypothetical protein [Streptomyces sp. DSM 40473]MDT0454021.1 hypothetical protein [Streptomyces sp. DSM 40473]
MTENQAEYGPDSPDYGLSYDPDPWAEPDPVDDPDIWESDFHEQDPNEDHTEAGWEQAFRDGHITREQFANRHRAHETDPSRPEAPDPTPVIQSAVDKLRAKLATADLSDEERDEEERVLASLEQMLGEGE